MYVINGALNYNQLICLLLKLQLAFTYYVQSKGFLFNDSAPATLCLQGESLGLRMPVDDDTQMETGEGEVDWRVGEFQFDDGGMRGLAAAICWIGLVYRCSKENSQDLSQPGVINLARSLMNLPTMRKTQTNDVATEQIRRIISQNVESKKLAISSLEWAEILRGMKKQGRHMSLQDAIQLYNNNPEITAHGGASSGTSTKDVTVKNIAFNVIEFNELLPPLYIP